MTIMIVQNTSHIFCWLSTVSWYQIRESKPFEVGQKGHLSTCATPYLLQIGITLAIKYKKYQQHMGTFLCLWGREYRRLKGMTSRKSNLLSRTLKMLHCLTM